MAGKPISEIRNIAFIGNAASGKTTLVEQLLLRTGAINNAGTVEQGNTVCDFDPMEKASGHSLEPALCHSTYNDIELHIVDTPGYPELHGRSLSVLTAVESAFIVVAANAGLDTATERLYQAARDRGLDCFLVINKIDGHAEQLPALLQSIEQRLGKHCLPINLPAYGGEQVIDCYFAPKKVATDVGNVDAAHEAIIDQIVELDEALMSRYLEQGETLTPEQLHDAFEQALREGHIVPVLFTSARTGAGLDEMLKIFAELAPNPIEANPPLFLKGEGTQAKPITVLPDKDKHALAHVFHVSIDPYVGRIAWLRVHQGVFSTGQSLFIGDARKPFKLAHLLDVQGKQTTEIPQAMPGDIVAISKVDDLSYDAVVHDSHEEDHHHLQPMPLPSAQHGLALTPLKHGDEARLSDALHKITAEDPSLRLEHRRQQNETVLHGIGEFHLKIALEKMQQRFNAEFQTHTPSVAYRETITAHAEGHARHKKQTGGAGQFGEVYLRVEPLPRGTGFEFVDKVVGGAIPFQFLPAVEKGVREICETGAIAGYPLQDLRVTVYDGKHHSVDSKEVAFIAAGKKAMLDAIDKAKPVILEPIASLSIDIEGQKLGDITSELSSHRGMITGTDSNGAERSKVFAKLPMGELPTFQLRLKSLSGGDGSLELQFSHYDTVPPHLQQELQHRYQRREEE